jgi:hypothetical protein
VGQHETVEYQTWQYGRRHRPGHILRDIVCRCDGGTRSTGYWDVVERHSPVMGKNFRKALWTVKVRRGEIQGGKLKELDSW